MGTTKSKSKKKPELKELALPKPDGVTIKEISISRLFSFPDVKENERFYLTAALDEGVDHGSAQAWLYYQILAMEYTLTVFRSTTKRLQSAIGHIVSCNRRLSNLQKDIDDARTELAKIEAEFKAGTWKGPSRKACAIDLEDLLKEKQQLTEQIAEYKEHSVQLTKEFNDLKARVKEGRWLDPPEFSIKEIYMQAGRQAADRWW